MAFFKRKQENESAKDTTESITDNEPKHGRRNKDKIDTESPSTSSSETPFGEDAVPIIQSVNKNNSDIQPPPFSEDTDEKTESITSCEIIEKESEQDSEEEKITAEYKVNNANSRSVPFEPIEIENNNEKATADLLPIQTEEIIGESCVDNQGPFDAFSLENKLTIAPSSEGVVSESNASEKDSDVFNSVVEPKITIDHTESESEQNIDVEFASSLPNWDLDPPIQMIRRDLKR